VPIPEYASYYSVSNLGQVRRETPTRHGPAGRIVKPTFGGGRGKGQYLCVRLSVDNRGRTSRIALLVAEAFIGPRTPGMQVNHIDGSVRNNTVENLEYVSSARNEDHAIAIGLKAWGMRHGMRKLTEEQVLEIRSAPRRKGVITDFMQRFGVSRGAVQAVRMGKTWRRLIGVPVPRADRYEKRQSDGS